MFAAKHGYLEIVKLLIQYGANVNAMETIYGRTALAFAAAKGHADCVQYLLDSGAIINETDADRFAPLHLAVKFKHAECVKVLGKHPNVDFTKRTGQTPLEIATEIKDKHLVIILKICEDMQRRKLEGQKQWSY